MVVAALLLACLPMYGFVHHPTVDYKLLKVQGHPVYLSPEAASDAALLDRVVAKQQPFLVLHEMSHAYHHQVLGFDHATVRQAFDLAVSGHRYDSVPYVNGGNQRAYALNNHKEYFAELSEACWGKNEF